MRVSRRMARMQRRNKRAIPKLNLTSLMDVFTVLVFFLIFNSSATVETLQNMEYSVDNLQMRRGQDGGAEVSGSVTNRTLSQGSSVTLVFTFYAASGAVLGTASQTVAVGAEGMAEVFQLQFSSAEQVGGYGYQVAG